MNRYLDIIITVLLHRLLKTAADVGVNRSISGHSLRVGSAVSLAKVGASVVDLQVTGRWKNSQMPAHYARAEMAERGLSQGIRKISCNKYRDILLIGISIGKRNSKLHDQRLSSIGLFFSILTLKCNKTSAMCKK